MARLSCWTVSDVCPVARALPFPFLQLHLQILSKNAQNDWQAVSKSSDWLTFMAAVKEMCDFPEHLFQSYSGPKKYLDT